jgi:ABC-2 type transport system permease protein
VLGLVMPWADLPFNDADPILKQVNGITGYAPTVLALAVATVGLSAYPQTIAGYRGRGVLKRMSTTPVPPSRILVAQLAVNLVALLVAAVLMFVAGVLIVDVAAPAQPLVLVGAFLLSVLSAFAVGSVIAALAPNAPAATAWGMSVYFVSLFFAGVWLPLPLMPDVIQTIAGYTPLGAASEAMAAAWYGQPFEAAPFLVMAAWTLVALPVAARFFRWS